MVIYSGYWPDWSISRDVIGRLSVKLWCYWLWRLLNLCLTSTYFQYNGKHYKQLTRYSYGFCSFCYCSRNCYVKHRGTSRRYLYANCTFLVTLRWRTTLLQLYTKTKSTIFTISLTDRTRTYISPRRSRKMVKYLLWTAWSLTTTKDSERKFTENRHIPTDY